MMRRLAFCSALNALSLITVSAQQPSPFRLSADDPALNLPLPVEYTSAEMAPPPVGQIQKRFLRQVNELRGLLAATLTAVPANDEGTESPWFMKAQAYKTGLDTLAASSLQSDCFALIPKIADLLAATGAADTGASVPDFALDCAAFAKDFSTVLVHSIERYVIDQNGVVPPANLLLFVTVYSTAGFRSESDWEESPIPVDSASLMILDASAVVTYLKDRPWREAEQFLGNKSANEAFDRYVPAGDGLAILKTKYAADSNAIIAKWNEITAWVTSQRPSN